VRQNDVSDGIVVNDDVCFSISLRGPENLFHISELRPRPW
jgi:hypothetical protein